MTARKQTFAALLRAVNVGGTGKLAMADLKAICEQLRFEQVQTYIASGNVLFRTSQSEADVVATLQAAIEKHMGKPINVLLRTAAELEAAVANNPFADAPGNRVIALFLPTRAQPCDIEAISGKTHERLALGVREIYVHYGGSMADSRLKIAAATRGTARNMNTVSKLAALCADMT